jgi:Asp-tRNA(Asn)/Glu-tRNA(Gln) amidotransferase B subunit
MAQIATFWHNTSIVAHPRIWSIAMSTAAAASSAFNSVKLPAPLVTQARAAALTFRRSTAGQIEYWAMLGKAVEESGITVREVQAVMEPVQELEQDVLDAIEAKFDRAASSGALAKRMREVIAANQSQAKQLLAA